MAENGMNNEKPPALHDLPERLLMAMLPGTVAFDSDNSKIQFLKRYVCNECKECDYMDNSETGWDGRRATVNSDIPYSCGAFFSPTSDCPKVKAIKNIPRGTLTVFATDGKHLMDRRCINPLATRCSICSYALGKGEDPGCAIISGYCLPTNDEIRRAQWIYEEWLKEGCAYSGLIPDRPKAKVNLSNGAIIKVGGKAQESKEYYVYRYVDRADGITKYVGITNNMKRRVNEHTIDKLADTDWEIWFMSGLSKTDAMLLESHFISKYKTYKYFNVAKASDGIARFLKATPKWELYGRSNK